MRILILSSIIACFFQMESFSQRLNSDIDKLMNVYAENEQFNGVILVQKCDTILYQKAFGYANREWNVENDLDSKFLIGSISKPITSLITLILVNDGLLDLDSNINRYIPDYVGPGENEITIHQMLTHTSGIPNHGAIEDFVKKRVRWIYSSDEYLNLIKDVKLQFKPGYDFQYSGIAYNLLAIICERVTNTDFSKLLHKRIFLPLNMMNTKLDENLDIEDKRAAGYEYYLLEGYKHPSYLEMCHVKGSGGILSTIEDLHKFNLECFKHQRLMSKSLYEKMFTPYIKSWQDYGYGWWIINKEINGQTLEYISHGGSLDGYKAYLTRVVQDSIDIITLQNNYYRTPIGRINDDKITNEIIKIIYDIDYKLPKKSIAKELGLIIGNKGIIEAEKSLINLKQDSNYYLSEYELNLLGDALFNDYNLIIESSKIFELALNEYPNSFILNYSYGNLLFEIQDKKAFKYYEKCTDLYAKYSNYKKHEKKYEDVLIKLEDRE